MKLRPRRTRYPEITLTPLIDVVFLLLIFFMVSTTFERHSEITLELPEASAGEPSAEIDRIEISIDAQGHYFVNQQALVNNRPETLKKALHGVAQGKTEQPLVINADGRTPHQAVITAMDIAGQLGFRHLTFATRLEKTQN